MPADELITTSVEYRGGAVVLVVGGEIDLNTAPILHTAICEALAGRPTLLVLDLSRVAFFAAAGLGVLLQTEDMVGGKAPLALVCSGEIVSKVIRLVGLDTAFSLYETVDAALASISQGTEGI
jgi:anti-sigma B factor antagonist